MAEQAQIIFDKVDRMECPSCHAQIDVGSLQAFTKAICPSCGSEVSVPGRLGNYLLLNCLGSGGMGSVYRAYDETLARVVAIKVMLRSLGDAPEFLCPSAARRRPPPSSTTPTSPRSTPSARRRTSPTS